MQPAVHATLHLPHRAPRATRAALRAAVREGLQPLRAVPPMSLADWAPVHFKLSQVSSHQAGQWESWAFQIGWMDAFSNDDIEEVDVMKSKRVGYTKTLVAFVAYEMAHRRRKLGLWQPTDDDRDSFVKDEIDPILDEDGIPALRAARASATGSKDTIKHKSFKGAVLHLLGGKAARAYRRLTLNDAVLDEIDGFDQKVEGSLDPVTGAHGRLEGAPFPKLIVGSTPRIKNFSHVERRADMAHASLRYHITCPHCEAEHPLQWTGRTQQHGFKWDGDDPRFVSNVRHVCPHCHGSITQADYLRVYPQGVWVCDRTGIRYGADRTWRDAAGQPIVPPRHVAFRIWAAYSPQRDWPSIAIEYLGAEATLKRGENGPMQGFRNETLGETWEEEFEKTEADVLRKRARAEGLPMAVVPAAACVVQLAVDVQADRWEMVAWAKGRGAEAWAIDYRVIYGNPSVLAEWGAKIEPLIGSAYPHAKGGTVAASAMAIDTGFQTHVAYEFCRVHKQRNVHAVKGDSQAGRPIKARRSLQDINLRGRTQPADSTIA